MHPTYPIYTIRVTGDLDPTWSDMLGGMAITSPPGLPVSSCLIGPVRDQAVLRGIVNKLWDLNLTILSITRMEDPPEPPLIE